MWTMKTGDGHRVANDLDRGHVNVVVDDVDKNARPWYAGVTSAAAAEDDAKLERQSSGI